MGNRKIMPMDERFQEYLSDESKLTGWADAIAFPENEEELIAVLKENAGKPVTIQGAKTGLAGGAVPEGGLVLNLSRMNHGSVPIRIVGALFFVCSQPFLLHRARGLNGIS